MRYLFSIVQKENNYSVGSGAEITCARLGFENYQILAAGDDQKNVIVWKITRTKPRLVSTPNFELNNLDSSRTFYKCVHRWL